MKNTGFKYEFTLGELLFLIFGKKTCPNCGNKLIKKKDYTIRTDLFHTEGADSIFKPDSEVKQYSFNYVCNTCKFSSSLAEMAKGKRRVL